MNSIYLRVYDNVSWRADEQVVYFHLWPGSKIPSISLFVDYVPGPAAWRGPSQTVRHSVPVSGDTRY